MDFNHKPVEVEMMFFPVVVARASRWARKVGVHIIKMGFVAMYIKKLH